MLDAHPKDDHISGGWMDDDELYGESGDDLLVGNNGNNILDGGEGSDTLVGGDGTDIFVLREGDGSASEEGADIIKDFSDGFDLMSLPETLSFDDLYIYQGNNGVVVSRLVNNSGAEILAVLENIQSDMVTISDFIIGSGEPKNIVGDDTDNVLVEIWV